MPLLRRVPLTDGNGRPVLFPWGTTDPVLRPDAPAVVISTLQAEGWNPDHHAYEMARSQTIEMMIDARAWFSFLNYAGGRCADFGRNASTCSGSVVKYGPPIRSTQYGTAAITASRHSAIALG